MRSGYRALLINRHAVYYTVKASTIHVVRVFHGQMDPERNSFSRGHFEIRKVECGSFKVRDWITEAGNEKMYSGAVQGATDGHIYSDGRTVRVSFQTERLKGKYEARDWDDRTGHCNKPLDKKVNTSKSEATELERITVSFEGKVDPENPNEIYIRKVLKKQDGKEQEYFEMRLRRAGP